MGHSYTDRVIKLLFATARTCAFPGCGTPLVFVDDGHAVREIAVQIAHIRSPKPGGPRHDPAFPADQLNSEGNLLLLCGVHHHPVDRNESTYTIEELQQWKEKQVAEGGGFTLRDDEIAALAARLESALDELVRATRPQLRVQVVGGRIPHGMSNVVRIDLAAFEEHGRRAAHLYRPERLVGVEAENQGPVSVQVRTGGIDIDHGPDQPGPWQYAFAANNLTPWQFPCLVDGYSACVWFDGSDHIRAFTVSLYRTRGLVPRAFRPWVIIGNGDRLNGEWFPRADLPVWGADTGEDQLRAFFGD
jgi:hypothetical protein